MQDLYTRFRNSCLYVLILSPLCYSFAAKSAENTLEIQNLITKIQEAEKRDTINFYTLVQIAMKGYTERPVPLAIIALIKKYLIENKKGPFKKTTFQLVAEKLWLFQYHSDVQLLEKVVMKKRNPNNIGDIFEKSRIMLEPEMYYMKRVPFKKTYCPLQIYDNSLLFYSKTTYARIKIGWYDLKEKYVTRYNTIELNDRDFLGVYPLTYKKSLQLLFSMEEAFSKDLNMYLLKDYNVKEKKNNDISDFNMYSNLKEKQNLDISDFKMYLLKDFNVKKKKNHDISKKLVKITNPFFSREAEVHFVDRKDDIVAFNSRKITSLKKKDLYNFQGEVIRYEHETLLPSCFMSSASYISSVNFITDGIFCCFIILPCTGNLYIYKIGQSKPLRKISDLSLDYLCDCSSFNTFIEGSRFIVHNKEDLWSFSLIEALQGKKEKLIQQRDIKACSSFSNISPLGQHSYIVGLGEKDIHQLLIGDLVTEDVMTDISYIEEQGVTQKMTLDSSKGEFQILQGQYLIFTLFGAETIVLKLISQFSWE